MLRKILSKFRRRSSNRWVVGEAWEGEFPVIVRARETIPAIPDSGAYTFLIEIRWRFESDSSGMPSDDVIERMGEFEDLIEGVVERPDVGFQMVCCTGHGQRRWHYYARDVGAFMAAFNSGLAGREAFPVELSFREDPNWNEFKITLHATKG